jgi:BirA family transcriptional regulator, biotin operon repressor / biotin---[acetyl-CoA-carboxylase] ligase
MDGARIEVELALLGATVGLPLTVTVVTTSTNDDAKRAAAAGAPHGAAFVSDCQTAGRGRGGHAWHSPARENVYLSLVLRLGLDPTALAPLPLVAGIAVARVVDIALAGDRARIKWPNDVYVDEKKIAGVLAETTTRAGEPPVAIVGVGLNVLGATFPEGFPTPPTSLQLAGPEAGAPPLDRDALAAALLHELGTAAAELGKEGLAAFRPELARRDFLAGRRVTVGDVAGTAAGFDERGSLLVRSDRGALHALASGEVRWQTPR